MNEALDPQAVESFPVGEQGANDGIHHSQLCHVLEPIHHKRM